MAYEQFVSAEEEGGGYFDMSLRHKEELTLGRSGISIGIKKMALELWVRFLMSMNEMISQYSIKDLLDLTALEYHNCNLENLANCRY